MSNDNTNAGHAAILDLISSNAMPNPEQMQSLCEVAVKVYHDAEMSVADMPAEPIDTYLEKLCRFQSCIDEAIELFVDLVADRVAEKLSENAGK